MRNTPFPPLDELAVRRGVPSLAIRRADLPGAHDRTAKQPVHERGFAHTGGAKEANGRARCEILLQRVDARTRDRADAVYRNRPADRVHPVDIHRRVRTEIRLCQYHDRFRAAMQYRSRVSGDPIDAIVLVHGCDEKAQIDIRCHRLFAHRFYKIVPVSAAIRSGDIALPRQNGGDVGIRVSRTAIHGHIVADHGIFRAVKELSGQYRAIFRLVCDNLTAIFLNIDYARDGTVHFCIFHCCIFLVIKNMPR